MRFIAGAFPARISKENRQRLHSEPYENCATDDYDPIVWKFGGAEFPRRVMMGASLEQARKESDAELKRLARSPQATDSAQAYDLIKATAIGAPPTRRELLALDFRISEAFVYNDEELLVAAKMRAAEFEGPRSFLSHSTEDHIFKMLIAANGQVAEYWRGGLIGAISFRYRAATANGATFDGTRVLREGWGHNPGASFQRIIQAVNDVRISLASLDLLAWKLAWLARMVGPRQP